MATTDFLTQQQLEKMMNQRFGVPEGTATESPLSFRYQEEEYPNQPETLSPYLNQMPLPDISGKRNRIPRYGLSTHVTHGVDPAFGMLTTEESFDENMLRRGPPKQEYYGEMEIPRLMQDDFYKHFKGQTLENIPVNRFNFKPSQGNVAGITAANVPFQDFSFSEYQGPSQEVEGDFPEQQKDEPWYSAITSRFKRPQAKQAEFEAYEKSMDPQGWGDFGDYRGNIYQDAGSGLNKIDVVDPATGATLLQGKNFDSMFGSDSVEEMIAKKNAWIRNRIAKNKPISTKLKEYATSQGYYDDKPTGEGWITRDGVSDRAKIEAYTGQPMSAYRASRPASERQYTGHGKSGMGRDRSELMAAGGYMRRGYSRGGKVGILSVL